MSLIRFSRLSLIAFAAGSCLALAPSVIADDHGKSDGHGAKPADAGHGSEAKPQYAPPPTAKPVGLKSVPAAEKPKTPATAEPKTPVTPVKPVSALKPIPKPAHKSNADAADGAAEALAEAPKSADEALAMLREGNQRWMDGSVQNPSIGALRRKTAADAGQKPFAVVLTCADSRIPVERVFDRGVGEVFVSRVAGNVSGPHEAGTIEYALEHLNVPVLIVMGHSRCGAVKATAEGAHVTPNIASLVESIKPAVERARKLNPQLEGAELVEAAVRENVWQRD
ncbi:MAG TPA: carbonic anhydrase, partial [Phycisphaerales bacterium]|nr:carbonic anhydrase [Phycisphaerales bacterium]